MKKIFLTLPLFFSLSATAAPSKILVVLSSENKITLKDGVIHPTGFFLSELMVPTKALKDAGYETVFATPDGRAPAMDRVSDSAFWFGGDERLYQDTKESLENLDGLKHPLQLSQVRSQDLSQYAGIFLPGGHAPMEDLLVNKDLGFLLKAFHAAGKPTALICHAPISLLSAMPDAVDFVREVAAGDQVRTQDWIYRGYRMTVFSTPEESQEEPGQDNALGGFVKFYPAEALSKAGARVDTAQKWHSHIVRDRELITAQNPMSDVEFAQALIQALSE